LPFEKKDDDLGALWMRHGSKGEYMTGTINGVKVVVFPNDRKGNEKAPDWRVLKSKPREERGPKDIGGGFTEVSDSDIF
jgi:uncharacterized protein (DUF736 family)